MSAHLLASKPNKNPLTADVRDKKTNYPSQLILKTQIPTKKKACLATAHLYLLSHKSLGSTISWTMAGLDNGLDWTGLLHRLKYLIVEPRHDSTLAGAPA